MKDPKVLIALAGVAVAAITSFTVLAVKGVIPSDVVGHAFDVLVGAGLYLLGLAQKRPDVLERILGGEKSEPPPSP